MKQKLLKELLREAADPKCSWQRQNEIQYELGKASLAAMRPFLGQLYIQTLENQAMLLPSLFPAFAIICGDRGFGYIAADVNWELESSEEIVKRFLIYAKNAADDMVGSIMWICEFEELARKMPDLEKNLVEAYESKGLPLLKAVFVDELGKKTDAIKLGAGFAPVLEKIISFN